MDLEAELDRLYALPRGDFTAARNELVGQLKHAGERGSADEIKGLRKPTAAVWLANRLARERKLDVQRLAKTGEALMEGKSRSKESFAEARRVEQQTLRQLSQAAKEIASREGIGAAAVARAIEMMRAAALNSEARELLKRGRLSQELAPPGLEALEALAHSAGASRRAPGKKRGKTSSHNTRDRLRDLVAEERRLTTEARETEREATKAEVVASKLRRKADAARIEAKEAADRTAAARRKR